MINNSTISDAVATAVAAIASTVFDAPSQRKTDVALSSKHGRLIPYEWHFRKKNIYPFHLMGFQNSNKLRGV